MDNWFDLKYPIIVLNKFQQCGRRFLDLRTQNQPAFHLHLNPSTLSKKSDSDVLKLSAKFGAVDQMSGREYKSLVDDETSAICGGLAILHFGMYFCQNHIAEA